MFEKIYRVTTKNAKRKAKNHPYWNSLSKSEQKQLVKKIKNATNNKPVSPKYTNTVGAFINCPDNDKGDITITITKNEKDEQSKKEEIHIEINIFHILIIIALAILYILI